MTEEKLKIVKNLRDKGNSLTREDIKNAQDQLCELGSVEGAGVLFMVDDDLLVLTDQEETEEEKQSSRDRMSLIFDAMEKDINQ